VAVRDSVAEAAAAVWRVAKDNDMRALAIRLDREQLEAGQRTASSLRRLGELMESTGDNAAALDACGTCEPPEHDHCVHQTPYCFGGVCIGINIEVACGSGGRVSRGI
jgi:hypothetical protein